MFSLLDISEQWDVLGPFQIGTREAVWGADPLESYGGFRSLSPNDSDNIYWSTICPDGRARWSQQVVKTIEQRHNAVEVQGIFEFPNVDWSYLQNIHGWSALQYQGWARVTIYCHGSTEISLAIFADGILEFWLDDRHFFGGDFFSFRRAPVLTNLTPGKHRIDVRLVRDIRSMGGSSPPVFPITVRLETCPNAVRAEESKILISEFVNGRGFPAPYGSIPLSNTGSKDVVVRGVRSMNDDFKVFPLNEQPMVLVPGQSRPFGFRVVATTKQPTFLRLILSYDSGLPSQLCHLDLKISIVCRNLDKGIKSTFLHPTGVVSYCIVVAPPLDQASAVITSSTLPILLNLHGSGVEAESDLVRNQLADAGPINAWTIIPTGGTTWCGDDWHTWGFADVIAAVASVPSWIEAMDWDGPGANLERWYVVGHSNGGQGTWFAVTHKPDLIAAAAPVSGYSSIQAYVSYNLWNEVDPKIWACIQLSLANFRNELLLPNATAIPILGQHGAIDHNVPVSHSRRIVQLLGLHGSSASYNEIAGEDHWFDGIMTTPPMRRFYRSIGDPSGTEKPLPELFRLVIPNSADMGSHKGIQVDQLTSASSLGYVTVRTQVSQPFWSLATVNVHRFHFTSKTPAEVLRNISIDGQRFDDALSDQRQYFVRGDDGEWICSSEEWRCVNQRSGDQRGSMDAILRSKGAFRVQYTSSVTVPVAIQISHILFQYFGADSRIVHSATSPLNQPGNLINLAIGDEGERWNSEFPISVRSKSIRIISNDGRDRTYAGEPGLGAIYLTPLANEALELRIWGYDISGLRNAARLLPMFPGSGQPDFVIISDKSRWSGAAGIHALGFFDHDWTVSEVSFL